MNGSAGLILRQFWNFMSLVWVLALHAVVKATFIQNEEPLILQENAQVMTAGRPIILQFIEENAYLELKYSSYKVDNWLYNNAKEVFIINKYV